MTFWDNVKKFAQPMGDDEYDDYDEDMDSFEEEAEPTPRPIRREARPEPVTATERSEPSGFSGKVLNMNAGKASAAVVLFRPTSFNEATKAADDLRDRKAVIVNMENVDPSVARRVVDFLSGCAYALDGKVKKIALATYLFCPNSMDVLGDLETLHTEAESSSN